MAKAKKQPKYVINGKLPTPINTNDEIFPTVTRRGKIRSIDELTGFKEARYKTHDRLIYAQTLNDMNTADIQRESARLGLAPKDDRSAMFDRLIKEFDRYTCALLTAGDIKQVEMKPTKRMLDLLSGGSNRPL